MSDFTLTPAELRDAAIARETAKRAQQEREREEAKLAQQEKDKVAQNALLTSMLKEFPWLAQWPITASHLGVHIELPECMPIAVSLMGDFTKNHLRFDLASEFGRWHLQLDEAVYAAKAEWEFQRDQREAQEQRNAEWAESEYGQPKVERIPDRETSLALIAKCCERVALVMEEAHK